MLYAAMCIDFAERHQPFIVDHLPILDSAMQRVSDPLQHHVIAELVQTRHDLELCSRVGQPRCVPFMRGLTSPGRRVGRGVSGATRGSRGFVATVAVVGSWNALSDTNSSTVCAEEPGPSVIDVRPCMKFSSLATRCSNVLASARRTGRSA